MLLAIDIGNSNIVFGVHHQQQWQQQWRIQSNSQQTSDEFSVLFQNLLLLAQIQLHDFTAIVLCSVVPQLTSSLVAMLKQHCRLTPYVVQHDKQSIIDVCTRPADKTGNDLIVNAIAAYTRYQSDCIVVDFGTATTISAIVKPGKLLGGAIAPGFQTAINALVGNTAQLPNIAIEAPPSVIGNNTIHAMQSGLVLGHVSMVEGLIQRMRNELNNPQVIATGGLATILASFTDVFDEVDPWLTLEGCRLALLS